MAELASLRRRDYAQAQPQFWREAAGAIGTQRRWFAHLIEDQTTLTLVAEHAGEVVGLLVASLVDPPPVYDPGGPSGFVDDFVVSAGDQWETVGRQLLVAARDWLREQGAAQIVVVAGFHDERKRAFLDSEGMSLASTWHVANLVADAGGPR
jgi:GNAT superfamily N-acetyltransferase